MRPTGHPYQVVVGLDINDEGGADCRKQTGLGHWHQAGEHEKEGTNTHEIKVVFKSSLYFLASFTS